MAQNGLRYFRVVQELPTLCPCQSAQTPTLLASTHSSAKKEVCSHSCGLGGTTRLAEAVPVSGTSMRDCAEVFFRGWISRFGVSDQLTSDRGAQFTSEVWAETRDSTSPDLHLSSSVEWPHRAIPQAIKDTLQARLASVHWVEHLPGC
jgi:hypothetical protein